MSVGWVGAAVSAVGVIGGQAAAKKQAKAAANANQAALDANAYQGEIATAQYEEYQKTYQPLERAMVADAQNYDSQEAYDKAASTAQATTQQQIKLAQERMSRQPGLDPSSAAAQAGQAKLALAGAAMGAGSANAARDTVKNTAWARKMDALGLGKGLVTGASAGLAQSANTAAALAATNNSQAAQTASGVGSMVTGLANIGMKAYTDYTKQQDAWAKAADLMGGK